MFVFVMWAMWPRGTGGLGIPYSSFLEQVQSGNVERVTIQGQQVTGMLATPVSAADLHVGSGSTAGSTPWAQFTTTIPEALGNDSLLPLLQEQGTVVDVAPPSSPWLGTILLTLLPVLLLGGLVYYMNRNRGAMGGGGSGIMDFGKSKARSMMGTHVDVTFEDVAGVEESKAELQEVVGFLKDPAKYHRLGAEIPKGVLLVGSPGTGKTLMARAVAGEAGVPFFHVNATEFVEMFVGVGASRVRDLFNKAKEASPAIVFIDELDAVGRRRGAGIGNTNDEREQTLNQLLVEMDGFEKRQSVIIMAATNRPDVLDPALLRPGRFDRQVTVPLPDRQGREAILRTHVRAVALEGDVDLSVLARSTPGFSGADLANLANEAALTAARHEHERATMADFEEALDKIVLGGERPLLLSERDRRIVAYHEGGHALVGWLSPEADPVRKVTIIPRGRALGVTQQLPAEDTYNYSRSYLDARIGVMLGGRAAEEVVLQDITTGAQSDLEQASALVRKMVTRWGMGSLGLVALEAGEQPFLGYELTQGRSYSDQTAARVDRNIQEILDAKYLEVKDLIREKRDALDRLAAALLEEETVGEDRLREILGPRPMVTQEALDAEHLRKVADTVPSATPEDERTVAAGGAATAVAARLDQVFRPNDRRRRRL
ncbi:MAG: ATP-dependent zinc metalloprotease FtsH [Chloroflexi bacterium]|nr:ATP-dependent zinc metalloprotease FtsH [Chloroflexota bacterium]